LRIRYNGLRTLGSGVIDMENQYEMVPDKDMTNRPDYEKEIVAIIRSNRSPKILRDQLDDYHENDIAEAIPELTAQERKKLFNLLHLDMLSDVLEHMDEEEAIIYLSEMDIVKAASVISAMESDDAANLLDEFPEGRRDLLMSLMDEESKRDVEPC